MAEEAKPDYLIIPLATTERMRVRRGRVEQLPVYCPIPLDKLVSTWLAVIHSEQLTEAQQNWERLRKSAAALGVNVPEGKLIYISAIGINKSISSKVRLHDNSKLVFACVLFPLLSLLAGKEKLKAECFCLLAQYTGARYASNLPYQLFSHLCSNRAD